MPTGRADTVDLVEDGVLVVLCDGKKSAKQHQPVAVELEMSSTWTFRSASCTRCHARYVSFVLKQD